MRDLTSRQREILLYIRDNITDYQLPPTRQEIAKHFGFRSANAANEHLHALARKGLIDLKPGTSRGIRLLPKTDLALFGLNGASTATEPRQESEHMLPIVGQVAAGVPVLASEHIEDHCHLAPNFFHPRADYLLRVKGMSMQNVGIFDGDLLAVHQSCVAENGQIVVARMDDEVTVKRFSRQGSIVHLLAENPDFPPIVLDLEHTTLEIEGIYVGVLRRE